MVHRARRRRRRRSEGRVPSFAGLLSYAGALVLVNVVPGWQVLPFLTADAAPVIALANLSLIACLVAQAVILVDDRPRLRAAMRYGIALLNLAVLTQAWIVFPFTVGEWDPAWLTVIRMVLVTLLVWDVWVGCKAAILIVQGRRAPRLAATHA